MNKEFEAICKMSQKELKKHLTKELVKTHGKAYVGNGYVYAQGTFPVLLVAHMDTVHEKLPNPVLFDVKNGTYSSPQGIGGDDRCGVYMILQIIKRFNCSVLFCEDEEKGGIGAGKFIETTLAETLDFNYAIEFDRRGSNDAVFYDCDNPDFTEFITREFYEKAYGSFSDISTLAPFFGCAAVNLSCGYYNAHSKQEYVVLSEMEASIEAACKILERTTEEDRFEYIESKYSSSYKYGGNCSLYGYGWSGGESGWYDAYENVYYYIIEYTDELGNIEWYETYASSEAEAVGRLMMAHPTLCYKNVTDVMFDGM